MPASTPSRRRTCASVLCVWLSAFLAVMPSSSAATSALTVQRTMAAQLASSCRTKGPSGDLLMRSGKITKSSGLPARAARLAASVEASDR
ncbi:hypothetical protein D3C87_1979140 [compost metagenome]